jgi:hypothetical protein
LLHVFITHQLNASQSEMQRPFGWAQAPLAFFAACFGAARAGHNVVTASAPANRSVAIDLVCMELPPVQAAR